MFHKTLAQAGPTRLTVDNLPRKRNRKDGKMADVVDVTLLPKGEQEQPVTLCCENIGIAEFFAEQELSVPFTVIAEGKDESAVVTKVGSSVQPPAELPKREEAPPGPRSPDREPPAREAMRGHTPHDTTRNGQAEAKAKAKAEAEMAAAKKARVLIARRVSLRRLCVVAVLACKRECEAMPGVPAMPDESFWQMVTSLYMSAEQEGYDTRMGYGNAMPAALTFDKIAEMAKRKEVAASEPQRGVEPPLPPAAEKCKDCREDGVCVNPECKANNYCPM